MQPQKQKQKKKVFPTNFKKHQFPIYPKQNPRLGYIFLDLLLLIPSMSSLAYPLPLVSHKGVGHIEGKKIRNSKHLRFCMRPQSSKLFLEMVQGVLHCTGNKKKCNILCHIEKQQHVKFQRMLHLLAYLHSCHSRSVTIREKGKDK